MTNSFARDELRYILDPKEIHGEDFPGETFRVLKEKEVRLYGDAPRWTSRLVLEVWDGQGHKDEGERRYVYFSRSWLTVMIFIPSYSFRSSK